MHLRNPRSLAARWRFRPLAYLHRPGCGNWAHGFREMVLHAMEHLRDISMPSVLLAVRSIDCALSRQDASLPLADGFLRTRDCHNCILAGWLHSVQLRHSVSSRSTFRLESYPRRISLLSQPIVFSCARRHIGLVVNSVRIL